MAGGTRSRLAAGRRLPGGQRCWRRSGWSSPRGERSGRCAAGCSAALDGRARPARAGRRAIPTGAPVFVDYAHTPDALEHGAGRAAAACRAAGSIVVFGCGGDRDPGKRPLMGAIAARARRPRDRHRRQPAQRGPGGDPRARSWPPARTPKRSATARAAIARRSHGARGRATSCVVAGKGHETGQIVGDRVLPFDDAEVARARSPRPGEAPHERAALDRGRGRGRDRRPRAAATGRAPASRSIRRTLGAGRSVRRAARAATSTATTSSPTRSPGAPPRVVDRVAGRRVGADAPLLLVADTMAGARRRSAARRAPAPAARSPRSPAASARPAPRRRSAWSSRPQAPTARQRRQPQQPLGRAARASPACRADARYGVFEIGMNHAGEIAPLTRMVRPHVALITTVEPAHLGVLPLGRGDRRRQGGDLPGPRAAAAPPSSTATTRISSGCAERALGGRRRPHRRLRRGARARRRAFAMPRSTPRPARSTA